MRLCHPPKENGGDRWKNQGERSWRRHMQSVYYENMGIDRYTLNRMQLLTEANAVANTLCPNLVSSKVACVPVARRPIEWIHSDGVGVVVEFVQRSLEGISLNFAHTERICWLLSRLEHQRWRWVYWRKKVEMLDAFGTDDEILAAQGLRTNRCWHCQIFTIINDVPLVEDSMSRKQLV